MIQLPRIKWLLLPVPMLVCSAALANDNHSFGITRFHAFATVAPDPPQVLATCHDASGNTYTNVHITGSGPITSTDPRMEGTFHANAMILTDQNGIGVSRDEWSITDPVTGAVKVRGVAQALDTDQTAPIIAVNTARLADGSFVSHIAVVHLPAPGTSDPITIEYGGNVPPDPGRAVIMSGIDCGGYFAADEDGYFPKHAAGFPHGSDD